MAFAFLAGALMGAGIALLLAPKPGAEAREQVGEWLRQAQEKAKEMAQRYGEDEEAPSDEPMPEPAKPEA
jgi:gas vesicle protein